MHVLSQEQFVLYVRSIMNSNMCNNHSIFDTHFLKQIKCP